MFLVYVIAKDKDIPNEMLCLVSEGVQSKFVVIFDFFGPLTLRHPFQCSTKVLKDEFLFVVGIVVAVAVRALVGNVARRDAR